MVEDAIGSSAAFSGSDLSIYTKGSYPNNTNVRLDSDVDVVVELRECYYFDYVSGPNPGAPPASFYPGPWTPSLWRGAVATALEESFGSSNVKATGNIAINVLAIAGSRPSADVVPSFSYMRFDDPDGQQGHKGSCVFPADGGGYIVNWPQQQMDNGRAKNSATGGRYKSYVRALKNAENVLSAEGTISDLPSYFMECLVFNVKDSALTSGDLDDGFRSTLWDLWTQLNADSVDNMVEPNVLKWLFRGQQKWTPDEAKALVSKTWDYLGYAS